MRQSPSSIPYNCTTKAERASGRFHELRAASASGAAIVILRLVAGACGSPAPNGVANTKSNPGPPETSSPAAATTAAATAVPVVVRGAMIRSLGTVLVNEAGRTLYMFTPDKQTSSTCTESCAQMWRPLASAGGTPGAGPGIEPSLLGTVQAPDGQIRTTYNRWPLYTFTGDAAPTQANGQGRDGVWFAVTVTGAQATSQQPVAIPAPDAAPTTPATPATAARTTPATSPPQVEAPAITSPRVDPPPTTDPPHTTRAPSPPTTAPATGGAGF